MKSELGSPVSFRTRTDTEVLLAAFARWGEACLDRLIGMFAFAILGRVEPDPLAARDRFGVKPLYYYEPPGADSGWPVRSRRCTPPASPLSRTRPRGRLTWRRVCTTTTAGRSGKGFGSCLRGLPVVDSERRPCRSGPGTTPRRRARRGGGPLGESEAGKRCWLSLRRAFGFVPLRRAGRHLPVGRPGFVAPLGLCAGCWDRARRSRRLRSSAATRRTMRRPGCRPC